VSVVLVVVECDHRQKINITFGIQKDFIYLLAKQQRQQKKNKNQTQANLAGDGEKNEMLCVYIIQYKTLCQE